MNDRELLEMAAKAACYKVKQIYPGKNLSIYYNNAGDTTFWNPLENDGDALRLAVDLGICVIIKSGRAIGSRFFAENQNLSSHPEKLGSEPRAAARRAIVRAAAEIGSQLS